MTAEQCRVVALCILTALVCLALFWTAVLDGWALLLGFAAVDLGMGIIIGASLSKNGEGW